MAAGDDTETEGEGIGDRLGDLLFVIDSACIGTGVFETLLWPVVLLSCACTALGELGAAIDGRTGSRTESSETLR